MWNSDNECECQSELATEKTKGHRVLFTHLNNYNNKSNNNRNRDVIIKIIVRDMPRPHCVIHHAVLQGLYTYKRIQILYSAN